MAVTRHVRINGVDLWIPVPYFKAGHIPLESQQKDVLLSVTYPEFGPLKERPQELLQKGLWFGHQLMFLIQDRSVMISASKKLESAKLFMDATHFVGERYGLEYFTAPPGSRTNRGELYLDKESGSLVGLITCTRDGAAPNPQCSYMLWDSNFLYDIAFDKDILPSWRDIENKTLALTEGFKSNPAARPSTSSNTGD